MFFRKFRPKPKPTPKRVAVASRSPLRREAVKADKSEIEIIHARLQAAEPLHLTDDKSLGFDPYNSKDKS